MVNNNLKFYRLFGAIQFFMAAFFILRVQHGSDQGFLLGYSFPRISIVALTLLLGLSILILPKTQIANLELKINKAFQKENVLWSYFSISLFIAGILFLLFPKSAFGSWEYYFERLRPLFVVLCIMPFQICFKCIIKDKIEFDKKSLRYPLIISLFLFLSLLFINVTKLGLSPDINYWNVAGIPLSSFQFLLVIFISLNIVLLIALFHKQEFKNKNFYIDLILIILLFISTIIIWFYTPMSKHFFSLSTSPPYNQPFPYSDARKYDLGAISVVNGWGINFGNFTDKPLYIGLLGIIHFISQNNYSLQTFIQIIILALIIPILYVLGKLFQNRFVGISIALVVLIKQRNAIVLSSIVASVNPKLFLTEVFTLLGLLGLTLLLFIWVKKGEKKIWLSFLIGCMLGFTSLIRLNPLIFIIVIPIFMLIVLWNNKKVWIFQSITLIIGFFVFISPWLVTGRNAEGVPYFFKKINSVTVNRYSQNRLDLEILDYPSEQEISMLARTTVKQVMHKKSAEILFDLPNRDYHKFPDFIINHTLHNVVVSFLILPDSLSVDDQNLLLLSQRPYWQDTETGNWQWQGELETGQIYFILINLILVSFGLYWSWKRWKWGGIVPLMIFLSYCCALGLARNSGSRYIVPIDWVVYFYYVIGIMNILNILFKIFIVKLEGEIDNTSEINPSFGQSTLIKITALIIFFCFLVIPITNSLMIKDSELCETDSYIANIDLENTKNLSSKSIIKIGQILYPALSNNEINAYFLTCKTFQTIVFDQDEANYIHGDLVVIGFKREESKNHIEYIVEYIGPMIQD